MRAFMLKKSAAATSCWRLVSEVLSPAVPHFSYSLDHYNDILRSLPPGGRVINTATRNVWCIVHH